MLLFSCVIGFFISTSFGQLYPGLKFSFNLLQSVLKFEKQEDSITSKVEIFLRVPSYEEFQTVYGVAAFSRSQLSQAEFTVPLVPYGPYDLVVRLITHKGSPHSLLDSRKKDDNILVAEWVLLKAAVFIAACSIKSTKESLELSTEDPLKRIITLFSRYSDVSCEWRCIDQVLITFSSATIKYPLQASNQKIQFLANIDQHEGAQVVLYEEMIRPKPTRKPLYFTRSGIEAALFCFSLSETFIVAGVEFFCSIALKANYGAQVRDGDKLSLEIVPVDQPSDRTALDFNSALAFQCLTRNGFVNIPLCLIAGQAERGGEYAFRCSLTLNGVSFSLEQRVSVGQISIQIPMLYELPRISKYFVLDTPTIVALYSEPNAGTVASGISYELVKRIPTLGSAFDEHQVYSVVQMGPRYFGSPQVSIKFPSTITRQFGQGPFTLKIRVRCGDDPLWMVAAGCNDVYLLPNDFLNNEHFKRLINSRMLRKRFFPGLGFYIVDENPTLSPFAVL